MVNISHEEPSFCLCVDQPIACQHVNVVAKDDAAFLAVFQSRGFTYLFPVPLDQE
jgi:hypothetical protein